MTGGAAILRWLEPHYAGDARPMVLPPSKAELVHTVLSVRSSVIADQWDGVEVASLRDARLNRDTGARTLVSLPDRTDFHFVVDGFGHVITTDLWRRQVFSNDPGSPGTIRVGLLERRGNGSTPPVSREQTHTFENLIEVLRDCCMPRPETLTVRLGARVNNPALKSWYERIRSRLSFSG